MTDVADKSIKEQIESINGVGEVRIIGGRDREIQIWVDPDKLRAFNVTVAQVAEAVRAQNMEVPGGRVERRCARADRPHHGSNCFAVRLQ